MIFDRLDPALAALRGEIEPNLIASHPHVIPADRRQPVGTVLLRVGLRPDPEEAEVEEPDRTREGPFSGESW